VVNLRKGGVFGAVLFAFVVAGSVTVPKSAHAQVGAYSINELRFFNSIANFAADAAFADATSLTVGAVLPWVGAVAVGAVVAALVIRGVGGQISVMTRSQADAVRVPITNPTPVAYFGYWTTGNANLTQYSTSFGGAGAELALLNASGGTNALCTDQTQPRSSAIGFDTYAYNGGTNHVCGGGFATFQIPHFYQCTVGGSQHAWSSTPGSGCTNPVQPPAIGGTDEWAPRTFTDPTTGQPVTGWEAPSDPATGTQVTDPTRVFNVGAPVNGVQPVATVIANPDLGYTVQTWSPTFTDAAHPTTQTGWTVQTVTINNAGNVVTSTITNITNNTTAPPTSGQTTTTSANQQPVAPAPPAVPVTCGSLDCESTQTQVAANTAGIHSDTIGIKSDTGAMRTDLAGVHTDTTGIHTDTTGIHTDTTAVLGELKATGAPTLPDQQARLDAQKSSDTTSISDATSSIVADQASGAARYFSWVWTAPSGSCAPQTAAMSSGASVTVDFCTWGDKVKALLGALFALFAAWSCYHSMFGKEGS
jgi:hypothetical protein